MRKAHYLKFNKNTELPSRCVFFDTETKSHTIGKNIEEAKLWFGHACFITRLKNGKWSTPRWQRFDTINQYWHWLKPLIKPRKKLYVFAHNMSFDFTVVKGFENLSEKGWKMIRNVIDSPPTILQFKKGDKSVLFLCTLNFFRMPLKELGLSLGVEKHEIPSDDMSDTLWNVYCVRDVDIIRRAMLDFFRITSDWDLGNFQFTLPSQAFTAYRHRFMETPIFIDDNEKALGLSRSAYLGGRNECFFLGKLNKKVFLLDINSQYPFIMRNTVMPTRLLTVINNPTTDEVERILSRRSVIAEVMLNTELNCFPIVRDNRLVFPVGQFTAVLASPELKYAVKNGCVVKILRMAVYEHAVIFKKYVDYFYPKRLEYKASGNEAYGFICKIFLNSLYGKFGQSGSVFKDIGDAEVSEVSAWREIDFKSKVVRKYRKFAGKLQMESSNVESTNSHPAIAAHVTSGARMHLWKLMLQAGIENVYYVDTDSLLVNSIGFDNLKKELDDIALGALKLELQTTLAVIYGCKDYVLGDRVKIKGIRRTAIKLSETSYRQPAFTSLKGMVRNGDINTMTIRTVVKHLTRLYKKGYLLANGQVKPLREKLTQGVNYDFKKQE